MKKILLLLPVFIFSFGLNACFWDDYSDLKPNNQKKQTYYNSKKRKKIKPSQQQLEQSIKQFIDYSNPSALNNLLTKLNPQTKKSLLLKKIEILNTQQKKFLSTFLNLAVDRENCEVIRILINHGSDINASSSDGFNPLTRATFNNSSNIIDLLVKLGADINAHDENGDTILRIATRKSHTNLIPILVKLGANPNIENKDGFTPLMIAIDNQNSLIIETLIKNSANINFSSSDGYSPLTRAAVKNLPIVAEQLVKLGADINAHDENGDTVLRIATRKSHTNLIPILVKLGANPNIECKDGLTPLMGAIDNQNSLTIKTLIKNSANINFSSSDGYSPLTRAVSKNLSIAMEQLIKLGVDINAPDENGNTALNIATRKSYTDLIVLLIKLGANTKINKEKNFYPLHDAIKKGNQSIIKKLLENKIDINAQDYDGNTALHIAIENSQENLVHLLIKHGANITLKNDNKISPALLAASYGKKEIAKILFKDQDPTIQDFIKAIYLDNLKAFRILVDLCKKDPFSDNSNAANIAYHSMAMGNQQIIDICRTKKNDFMQHQFFRFKPLHYAVMFNHNDLVHYFTDQCFADVNSTDYYGLTPIHYAAIYGNTEIVNYLINKKCIINKQSTKDFKNLKQGSTCLDLAIQFGHTDIINILTNLKVKTNLTNPTNIISNQSDHLAIFIDRREELTTESQELASVKTSFTQEIRDIIKQKVCPAIIIGQHLLRNALQMSCNLKEWFVSEIVHNGVEGYIIIPKKIIPYNFDFKKIGIEFSSIQNKYVDEAYVKNKKINNKLDEKEFSASIPLIINALLLPQERSVYWGGHGNVKYNPTIGNLFNKDASKLFDILANKKTKIVYVSSCFFGGKNCDAIKDFNDMIVLSSSTTEVSTLLRNTLPPTNWRGFFNGLAACKYYKNNGDYCQYLANQILPLLIGNKPHISNFPHIKFTGKSKFNLIPFKNKAMLLNQEAITRCNSSRSLVIENQKILEIDMQKINNSIEIKDKLPLLISDICKNVFEKIQIKAIKAMKNNSDFIALEKLVRPDLFTDSTLENTFLIKELLLPIEFTLNLQSKNIKLPKTLYNVLINRGPSDKCGVFLSTAKIPTKMNSFFLGYDNNTLKWNVYSPLSEEELGLYKKSIS